MHDKTVPAIISVVSIVALIFIIKFIITPAPPPEIADTDTVIEQPTALPEKPTPIVTPEPESIAPDNNTVVAEPAPSKPSLVEPPLSLEGSDPQVLLSVADFAPKLTQWLLPKEQIRKWVLAVDLMADGKLPKRYRPLDYPMVKFIVEQQDANTVIAAGNYGRMNTIIETLTSIDPERLASYYQEWLPILEKAYSEQGKPDTFDQRFRQTISQVLAAVPLENNPALTRPSVLYRYADDKIEQASDIDKLLWRMGPENSEQLQDFVRELRFQLDQ